MTKNLILSKKLYLMFATSAVIGLSTLSCSPSSPKLAPPPLNTDEKVTDANDFAYNPSVDILFVVDNSPSMNTKQQRLASNIHEFTAALQNNQILDYHIAVITSTMNRRGHKYPGGQDGQMVGNPKVIDRNTPNGLKILEQTVMVGEDGSPDEEFLEPIHTALSDPTLSNYNSGFLRPDATLAIVIMTDTEDLVQSQTPQSLFNFLVKLKGGDRSKVLAYGAIIPVNVDPPSWCERDSEGPPYRIEQFLRLVNDPLPQDAYEFSICDIDYGKKLGAIANNLVARVGETIYLSREPDPSTIEVTFGTQIIPNDLNMGWVYDPSRKALRFGPGLTLKQQPAGTKLKVSFVTAKRT